MKILHTSDWHLGQNFMGMSRKEEHLLFLNWLTDTISQKDIDILIIAGDIFDTSTPPNYAEELYYSFLVNAKEAGCKKIIIIGGNHDSVSMLKAPKKILSKMSIDIVAGEEDEESIIPLEWDNRLHGIVCAVPFLRDTIIRKSLSGESSIEKEQAITEGIKRFYIDTYKRASKILADKKLPIIATGHLTTISAKTSDSEREIYIGSLSNISASIFDKYFDYTALGHIHRPQKITDRVYYSGSPIPLSFSEANQQKSVNIIEFDGKQMSIDILPIPTFRPLITLKGNKETLIEQLASITDKSSWIELILSDKNPILSAEILREFAREKELEILAIKTDRVERALKKEDSNTYTLEELDIDTVFNLRLLKEHNIDEDMSSRLKELFKKIAIEVQI